MLLIISIAKYACVQLNSCLQLLFQSLDLYKVAVDFKLFPSLWQRPLFLEKDLRAQPWWNANETGLGNKLETVLNGRDIMLRYMQKINNYRYFNPCVHNYTLCHIIYDYQS